MELADIIDVNELFAEMYPYVATQVLEAYRLDAGDVLEIGPFAGGVSIELARRCEQVRVWMGDDFPGLIPYFQRKVDDAALAERINIQALNKLQLAFPDGRFDLVVFRGGLFFWEDTRRIIEEAYRVLKSGGLAMVGGGFGASTPDSIIESISARSRELNRKLGKRVLNEDALWRVLRDARLDKCSTLERRHGLWVTMRKP